MEVMLTGNDLKLEEVIEVARHQAKVKFSPFAEERITKARNMAERLVKEGRVVYGITTGVGDLSQVIITPQQVGELQKNIIRSHAAGVGELLDEETVRAMMLLRLNALAKGYSGIRLETLTVLLEMLNRGVHPLIPAKGSVGASGDLAPLAHLALVMIGEGEAVFKGEVLGGKEALARAGITPALLNAKEGLALINGTQAMTAIGVLTVYDAERIAQIADIATAMSLEALKGTDTAFDSLIHEVRPHPGQLVSARNLWKLTRENEIIASHKYCPKVQDAYSLRCAPQVHGASRDAIAYVRKIMETEINSATDNPLLFVKEDRVISGGNFHGQPIALGMDFLSIALSELANISERRIERLVNPHLSGLPAFLIPCSGLNSGLMLVQYTAAALVSENKVLASPASVDSIPTSANQEDHVSMGTIAARKAREILNNTQRVLAIELLCGAQALEFLSPLMPGKGTKKTYEMVRSLVPKLNEDRPLYSDMEKIFKLVKGEELIQAVESAVGELE